MLVSTVTDLGGVRLPAWQGRQKYMHSFDPRHPLMAEGYEDYGEVVAGLCRAAGVEAEEAHMTVDEAVAAAGMSQRRPGRTWTAASCQQAGSGGTIDKREMAG